MDYLLGRHFASLVLILLFVIWLLSQRRTRDKELRYFWLTVISCFLLVIEDQIEVMASLDPSLRFWRTVFSIAGYVLRSTAAIGLVLVVCKPEHRTRLLWLPCVINLLVCSTSFFTDIAFGFDENYAFYRGPLGYVAFVVPILYLVMILWITFKRYGEGGKFTDRVILITCAAVCLLSAALDATRGGVRLNEAIIISCIFFYVFLRSYDIRRDSLTKLLNRQSMYEDCEALGKNICAAASLDMNGLKAMNDSQGHYAGDMALKKIGESLNSISSHHVRAYRIGGDEFVILFFRRDETFVRETLETIRQEVEEAGYSISYGYAMREEKDNPESMIQRSDMKMFERKAQYYRDKQHDRRQTRREKTNAPGTTNWKAVEESPQPIAVYRLDDHRVETLAVSDGFCALFGYPDRKQARFVLDNERNQSIHPADQERFSGAVLRFSDGKEGLDVVYRTSEGMKSDYRVIHARGTHVHTEDGTRIGYVWYMDEGVYVEGNEDAGTQINQMLNTALHEESILHATNYDSLTGIPNLPWFFKLCEAGKARVLSEGKQGALLYIDLNGMKYFNQKNGFAKGDRLLTAFAELLVRIFGKENCCHIAADRFAASTEEDGMEERIGRLFEEAKQMNDGETLPVRIGIYTTSVENVPVTTAYDRAKMACDAVRRSDVSSYILYSKELREEARKHQYLIENIDKAIEEEWIQVYYQPIVRAVNEKICDEEALARWIDPVEGFMSPAEFIPQLEKAGLIYKLDLCVLDQVLKKINDQKKDGVNIVPHSINLSRADFDACDIVEEIRKRVDAAGVSRDLITVEITESVIGSDFDFMKEQISRFRKLGFAVWMDDFGSGYSSLDVLQSIQFDLIKFDMSFIRKLDEGESGKIILTELMKMATSLGLDTVCEGVETEAQVRFLQEIGCSKLQGFFFGKPLPLEQLKENYYRGQRIGFEDPDASAYFETIGRVDLYDLGVISGYEKDSFQHAFDTLPMGIVEINGDKARFVRSNPSYRQFIRRFFGVDMTEMTREFIRFDAAFMENISKTCCEQGNRAFYNEKMPDGSVVHSFARRIGINPANGNQAVAIAVLSISDPAEAKSQADLARMMAERDALARVMAIAEDYISLYSVDPESGRFIEYTSSPEYETLGLPREGDDFFRQAIEDGEKVIFPEDLPKYLEGFTKDNILQSIRESGKFSMSYRLVIREEPVFVSLKIAPFQTGMDEKFLAGVRKWRIRK